MGGILLNNLVIRLFWKNYTDEIETKESEKKSVNDETDSLFCASQSVFSTNYHIFFVPF